MLELIVAIFVLGSLIIYALLGGADFGGGIWNLLAAGPRAQAQRDAIDQAISPIWEANHVWLILIIVLLFTAFPPAFAAMMTALNIPMSVMLIGIVLRGSMFVFSQYDLKDGPAKRRRNAIFGAASFLTPFVQGLTLGALTTGQIHLEQGHIVTGFFAGWLTPFSIVCGVFAVALFAFLAATYMTIDTNGNPALQNDFRLRAVWSGVALGPIAFVVFETSKHGAPYMYHGLTRWWEPVLLVWTSVCAITAIGALWWRRFELARLAAIGQVTLILVGWSLAQYPNLITPDVTVHNSAAPQRTLELLLSALGFGAMLLLPSLAYLFRLFKSEQPK